MKAETEEHLSRILEEAARVEEFVRGMVFADYCADAKTRLAVERAFEIMGEALNRIGKIEPAVLASIREHRSIVSFRNILAHAYDHVEDRLVWGIIETDLKELVSDIHRIR